MGPTHCCTLMCPLPGCRASTYAESDLILTVRIAGIPLGMIVHEETQMYVWIPIEMCHEFHK